MSNLKMPLRSVQEKHGSAVKKNIDSSKSNLSWVIKCVNYNIGNIIFEIQYLNY